MPARTPARTRSDVAETVGACAWTAAMLAGGQRKWPRRAPGAEIFWLGNQERKERAGALREVRRAGDPGCLQVRGRRPPPGRFVAAQLSGR